jgi:hypothetical protein
MFCSASVRKAYGLDTLRCVCVVSGLARMPCVLRGRSRLVIISLWRLNPGDVASLDAGSSVVKMLCESP